MDSFFIETSGGRTIEEVEGMSKGMEMNASRSTLEYCCCHPSLGLDTFNDLFLDSSGHSLLKQEKTFRPQGQRHKDKDPIAFWKLFNLKLEKTKKWVVLGVQKNTM